MKKITKIIVFSSIAVFLAIIVGSYFLIQGSKKPLYTTAIVKRGEVIQEVSSTGKVKPASSVDLSFEKSGRVAGVYLNVGEKVAQGAILVALESSTERAQLAQYEATLDKVQADLASLIEGAKPEEIQVAQTQYDNALIALTDAETNLVNIQDKAKIDLANAYDDVNDTLQSAYYYADDAVNKQINSLFNNDNTENPDLTFQTTNSDREREVESQRVASRNALTNFYSEITGISSTDYEKLDTALIDAEANLTTIRNFLSNLSDILNITAGVSETTVSTYKGYTNTARTNVNTVFSNINNQKQALASQKATNQTNIDSAISSVNTAKNNLKLLADQLLLKKSPATAEQIASGEAQVKSAEANVQNIQAQLNKNFLISPISGVITKQEAKVGEIISPQTTVVSVISNASFEIEVFTPEVDVAKIKINDTAKITLDAYGDDIIFNAQVSQIDPAETILDGVSTYKTILQFINNDERIKSGMTANIDILTAKKENVLSVPVRAVIDKNGEKFVKILNAQNQVEEKRVETGLRGSYGFIEIISGINEGETIITSTNES